MWQKILDFISQPVFIWTVVGVALGALALWGLSYIVASYCVYKITLSRGKQSRWGRTPPKKLSEQSKTMYATGREWADANADKKVDVQIERDGLKLYGEYYDFGSDKCAMILSGRTESLIYGYYFAEPYEKCGYNVLVVDPRGHGLSDGTFNTAGFEESLDAIAWVEHIQEKFGVKKVVFHGICIGAAGGMYAITNEKCPPCVAAIVTEGMFPNFGESMKNHLIEWKQPLSVYPLINKWMIHYTGYSMDVGPLDCIDKLKKPLLMLHSKEDIYSTPEYAQKLFDKAGAENKKLVWYEHGRHSFVRINNTETYDMAIAEFLKTI